MNKRQMSDAQKEKTIAAIVVVLSISVLAGHVAESGNGWFRDLSYTLRQFIDPVQYMISMLVLNFIFVIAAIRKYKQYPNPFIDTLKWYFSILMINDFLILVLRIIQKENFITLSSGMTFGVGRSYMMLAAARGMLDLTMTSAATLLLVYGLIKYRPCNGEGPPGIGEKIGRTMLGLIVFNWLVSIPVNFSGFMSGRALFAWSLGMGQLAQVGIAALIYWVVKEYHRHYHMRFYRYLTWYFGISFILTGLNFTYSMGSFGIIQRFPAGEVELIGGFGQFVYYLSRITQVLLNYIMFIAITGYAEQNTPGIVCPKQGSPKPNTAGLSNVQR
ncbi:MAG: hypothetical protein CVU89_02275 [Firmicutes bacterium HGW-Firmicutes-14]|jgi:hypothetical protein|nr:MAG: hypothetical protein CVU89_02275 [Firmicutes bacterium HGW-Firmicutes-14]